MIPVLEALWRVKIEYDKPKDVFYVTMTTQADIGIFPFFEMAGYSDREKTVKHFKEFAKINNLEYKIVEVVR